MGVINSIKQRLTNTPGSGDQPQENAVVPTGTPSPTEFGPRGKGPMGFRPPGRETLHKGQPADEQSPKAIGPENEGGVDAMTLGVLTEEDRGLEAAPQKEQVVHEARPADAEPQRYAPERDIGPRIPETQRDNEPATGLGKGAGIPPGSVARQTGQTP